MVGVFWSQELEIAAIEFDAVEVLEVGVASLLFAYAEEVDGFGVFVDAEDLRDVPFAVSDLILELAGG
jgi:hypothetical protein